MKKKRSIVYVNFAPYDNAGRILNYLIDTYDIVVHFSYDHLRLRNGRRSILTVYENKKTIKSTQLLWLRTHPFLLFLSLPFVALAIFLQTLWYVLILKKKYGKFTYYLTVNAFTSWVGNFLRSVGLVSTTVFWVWDYFPPDFPDWRLRLARLVYLKFDKPSLKSADRVVMLNKNLLTIRRKLGIVKRSDRFPIVPIGTNPSSSLVKRKKLIIGHMGMLKVGQGLDLLFDCLPSLVEVFPKILVEIIGSGPDENYFKRRAKKFSSHVKFFGYIPDDNKVDKIIRGWSVGIATYVPSPSSEHYWTDPSKIKAYINQGVPVITTDVPEFAKEIYKSNAGIIIDYYKKEDFIGAVKLLFKSNNSYSKSALDLAKRYRYQLLYSRLLGN